MGTLINKYCFSDPYQIKYLINKIKSKIPVKKQSQHKEDESEWQL